MPSIKFITLGCKANQYDTQLIREKCLLSGFVEAKAKELADICLINTCTVTHKADADSLNIIRRAKKDNPASMIVVTGCLTELDAKKIKDHCNPSLIIRNKNKDQAAILLLRLFKPAIAHKQDGALRSQNAIRGISFFKDHTRAFLKVQDGCDNFCSYCKIPFVRGRSVSRNSQEILNEAKRLAQNGFQEIVLTGICLGDYGKDLKSGINLAGLLKQMEEIDALARIRLSSIEAKDVSKVLIKRISRSKKICKHLHIPLQSGDNQILKRMNRHYSGEVFLNLIKRLKKAIPGIAITTDVLVGFPGERQENFLNTVRLIKQISPLAVHIFPYSARQGTKAADFLENTSAQDIHKRIASLNQIARVCRDKYMRSFLNKKMVVLVEDSYAAYPGYWQGHTDNYLKVLIRSKSNLNKRLVSVKLIEFCDGLFKADFR